MTATIDINLSNDVAAEGPFARRSRGCWPTCDDRLKVQPDGWLRTFSGTEAEADDAVRGMLGRPGLWRWSANGSRRYHACFELPGQLLAQLSDEPELPDEPALPQALLDWMDAAAAGDIPAGWRSPSLDEVKAMIPDGAATVRSHGVVRECEIDRTDQRLAIRCPVLPSIRADLPAPRRRWLEQLVLDTHRQWRLVRLGLTEDPAMVAEVDLTGAPPALVPQLVPLTVDSLRWVVGSVIQAAAVVASGVASAALDRGPSQQA
jgi:hypothetical protein